MCLAPAFGSFWLAEVMHVSGVIATVAGVRPVGNDGRRLSMEAKTRETVETFIESVDFLINSLLFILIGLELKVVPYEQMMEDLRPIGAVILGLLVARALAVYLLYLAAESMGRPPSAQLGAPDVLGRVARLDPYRIAARPAGPADDRSLPANIAGGGLCGRLFFGRLFSTLRREMRAFWSPRRP
jgi:NhaP-type Na+/H+ or K+/H+ antiporter